MGFAASAQSSGAARVSVNKYWLLVLLCLAFGSHLVAAKEFQKNERKMTSANSGLKHAADSLINEDQLEQVMEYLQDAVDQTDKHNAECMQTIAYGLKEMFTKWRILYPQVQQVLMESDSSHVHDILRFCERTIEKLRIYFNLKEKSFTADVEDMEKELEDTLKKSEFQEQLHTEF